MDTPLVQLRAVSKSFAGRAVVEQLSFTVNRGEVFALLGPNGAGKTTTVRMLVGIIEPDSGEIAMSKSGASLRRLPAQDTGYLPEERGLYRELPIIRTLEYFGMLRGLDRREAGRHAHEWLERMALLDRRNERLDALSKGNQQRVQLIAAVLHRPLLAILDEPFTGLDPVSQEFFLELVGTLSAEGTTVILSAHQMDLVERVADRVLLMNRGRGILSGSVAELRGHLDLRPRLCLTLAPGSDAGALRSDPDLDEIRAEGGALYITLRSGADVPRFLARAVNQFPVKEVRTESPRLHEVFIWAVRDDDARTGESP